MTASHHHAPSSLRFQAARSIISEAALLAQKMQPSPGKPEATLKGRQDYVTEADRAVERFVTDHLTALFPHDSVLGEENGGKTEGRFRWVIDPIDGTSNYARGRNRWCISLGLFDEETPIAGIIHAPALGEVFTAQKGHGAFLNGRPIRASQTQTMEQAMVEIGWSPYVPEGWFQEKITAILALGTMPRSLGSGALALADVACGRSDGYLEKLIFIWDVAAALVILNEAGACVSPFLTMGGMSQPQTILACAPHCAAPLSRALQVEIS